MTAGDAAEGWNAEEAPKSGSEAFGKIAGNALEFNIATDRTMGGERMGQGRGARAKTRGTAITTPGDIADGASEIVK